MNSVLHLRLDDRHRAKSRNNSMGQIGQMRKIAIVINVIYNDHFTSPNGYKIKLILLFLAQIVYFVSP